MKNEDKKATAEQLANSAVRRALMEEESGMGQRSGVAAMSELQEDRQYNSVAPQSELFYIFLRILCMFYCFCFVFWAFKLELEFFFKDFILLFLFFFKLSNLY